MRLDPDAASAEHKNKLIREDVDRINEIERVTRVELPDLPDPDVLQTELTGATRTMKAIWDTLCIDLGNRSRKSELVYSALKVCVPFRSLLVTPVEHCRGIPAAILGRRRNLDHLYWMGGYDFCPHNATQAGIRNPYMDSTAVIAAGWPALAIIGELRVRLVSASLLQGKSPILTNLESAAADAPAALKSALAG